MNTRYLYLNTRDEFYRVEISRIVYFESDGNYTSFVLVNGQKGTVCMSLAQMQEQLTSSLGADAQNFARIGKRYIVNLNYIYRIGILKQVLTLTDGQDFCYQLPISKDALRKLRDMYMMRIRQVSATRHAEEDKNS